MLHIRPVLNGFIVECGCQSVVISTVAQLAAEIAAYYTDPTATEKRYIANAVNKPSFAQPEALVGTPQTNLAEQCGTAVPPHAAFRP